MATRKLDSLGTSVFCDNLAMMFGAGITSDEAVRLMREDAQEGPFFDAANAVHEQIEDGKTLSAAIADSGCFPEYAVSTIAAGELAGRTESTLKSLSSYYEEQDKLERRIKSAVMYPTMLLFLMALVLLVMVVAVLPVFSGVYESLAGDIAASSFAYVNIARVICVAALIITLVLAVVLLVCSIMLQASKSGRDRIMRLLEKFPMTREAADKLASAQFVSTLSIFVASGLNTDIAIARAQETVENPAFRARVELVRGRMVQGESLSGAIYAEKLIDPLYARMLISAAKSGNIEEALDKLARLLYEDSRERTESIISAVEPSLAGFLTVMVGLALLSVMLPLIGIMGGIG